MAPAGSASVKEATTTFVRATFSVALGGCKVTVNGASATVKGDMFEDPPPGVGLTTMMLKVPSSATSPELTEALS